MFIKSIVLEGFKSYGQRTEIDNFDQQFNAITGLNGSGKSNILDAICFVLGITNLTHVRANNMQDLIYKSGQAGINKATVTVTFDISNKNQCPPGFENFSEITVARQITMGGKNKYLLNGSNVPNKKVQDMFCSVGLNVNNPHFLIMQGKITKILNMKASEILAMLEEAAGTRMYEVKRQMAQKTIEKKDAKLKELEAIMLEELTPKLEKLKEERVQYLQFQRMERELEYLLGVYCGWQFHVSKKATAAAEKSLHQGSTKLKSIEESIADNNNMIRKIDEEIDDLTKKNTTEGNEKLSQAEAELKEKEIQEAKSNAHLKSLKENIRSEEKNKTSLEKNLKDDEAVLKTKEEELSKVQSLFEKLRENDAKDNEAFALSQKKFEALSAGMEVNDEGQAQTLQEQLMCAKKEATEADTLSKKAEMQLIHCKSQLEIKARELGKNSAEYQRDKSSLNALEKEVEALRNRLRKLNFSEGRMNELQEARKLLTREIRGITEKIQNFEYSRPYTKFEYRDPENNFDRRKVHGVVCRLMKVLDKKNCVALETAAGGRLYNVVIDSEDTGKKLLKNGNLQTRTTFIPLDKIQSQRLDHQTIKLAENLVGPENVQPALSLLGPNNVLQPAMTFIFGNVFICKDIDIAKQVAFHPKIKKRCITLDGDVCDPVGTMSGGATQKGGSVLLQLQEIMELEAQVKQKEQELYKIENEIRQMTEIQHQYDSLKQQCEFKEHELQVLQQRLQQTAHFRQQEEVDNLKAEIEQLTQKSKECQEVAKKSEKKAKDLEAKMKDSKGYKDRQLKEAEDQMIALKKKADKSTKEWKKREQEYEILKMEISELKQAIQTAKEQLVKAEETLTNLKRELEESTGTHTELQQLIKSMQVNVKKEKAAIAEKNKEIQKKSNKKEELLAQNVEYELEIKKMSHDIQKLKDDLKTCKIREAEITKRNQNDKYLEEGEKMSDQEGRDLERRIKEMQDIKNKLGRKVNSKAQSMFEQEEKLYNDLKKKNSIVETDKKKLITVMAELDDKKKSSLQLAFTQVSKDFGSIFSTLLPGANAKLAPPNGRTILDGIEIRVSLGGVWKDSLTELSGGQRSLAALSLILAMLLFKPAPLYILDEVDAALDLSHTQNIGYMLKTHFKKSQFIIVSLKDGMFSNATVLYRTKFIDGVSTVTRTTTNRSGSL